MTDDPFERAVRRTSLMSGKRLESPRQALALMRFVELSMLAMWATVLGIHWWLLPDPQWLRTAHTVLFLLGAGFVAFNLLFLAFVRRNGWIPDIPEEDLGV